MFCMIVENPGYVKEELLINLFYFILNLAINKFSLNHQLLETMVTITIG